MKANNLLNAENNYATNLWKKIWANAKSVCSYSIEIKDNTFWKVVIKGKQKCSCIQQKCRKQMNIFVVCNCIFAYLLWLLSRKCYLWFQLNSCIHFWRLLKSFFTSLLRNYFRHWGGCLLSIYLYVIYYFTYVVSVSDTSL